MRALCGLLLDWPPVNCACVPQLFQQLVNTTHCPAFLRKFVCQPICCVPFQMQTFLANVKVSSRSRFAVARPSFVVCNVRAPYSGGSNFWQYFYSIRYLGHPLISTENFTEIVSGDRVWVELSSDTDTVWSDTCVHNSLLIWVDFGSGTSVNLTYPRRWRPLMIRCIRLPYL